jgi:uncharacterized cupredoxin-like copper-binding protein
MWSLRGGPSKFTAEIQSRREQSALAFRRPRRGSGRRLQKTPISHKLGDARIFDPVKGTSAMKRLNHLALALLGLAMLLPACGSSSQESSTNVNVTMTDFQFSPRTFTVPAGQTITFHASNNGAVEHTFVVMKLGAAAIDKFTDADQANVYWQTKLGPGESVTETFTAPDEPGEYQIVCDIPGHFQAGMIASLVVK